MTTLAIAQWVAPILLLAFTISAFSAGAQGGFVFAPEALTPKFDRLNPATNLGQIFSISGLSRLLRSLIPGSAIVFIAYSIIQREMPEIAHIAQLGSQRLLLKIASLWFELSWKCGLVLLAWSAADYGFQRLELRTRPPHDQSRKSNRKQRTPTAIRYARRRRNLRRAMLRKIMAKDIARATAVVTNPTHYAVAIEYRPETMPAPVVVAKGRNLLAARIKAIGPLA